MSPIIHGLGLRGDLLCQLCGIRHESVPSPKATPRNGLTACQFCWDSWRRGKINDAPLARKLVWASRRRAWGQRIWAEYLAAKERCAAERETAR